MKFRADSPQWIMKEIISEMALKDHLYIKAKNTQSFEDWKKLRQTKNKIKKLLVRCQRGIYKRKTRGSKRKPQEIDAAEFMNKCYVNVGQSLAKEHHIEWDSSRCNIEIETSFLFQ